MILSYSDEMLQIDVNKVILGLEKSFPENVKVIADDFHEYATSLRIKSMEELERQRGKRSTIKEQVLKELEQRRDRLGPGKLLCLNHDLTGTNIKAIICSGCITVRLEDDTVASEELIDWITEIQKVIESCAGIKMECS